MTNTPENQTQNQNPEGNQLQNQIIAQVIPMLEKLITQLAENPPQNEDNMPGNDNKFMEIDDIVDNLVNAGIITASNFIVNVELFKGSPITVGITKPGDPTTDVTQEVNAEDPVKLEEDTEGINYTKYINLLFKLGAYTATDVARIAELGKLTPDQYKEITGKNYEASTVDQLEGTQ